METMTIDGQQVPVIQNSTYLVDFGPTSLDARSAWFSQYRATLNQAGKNLWDLPVPMEIVATGRTGRAVLRIFAPEPDKAVFEAERLADGDGPKVAAF